MEQLAAQGYKEIVITGVLVGAYGQEPISRPVMRLSTQAMNLPLRHRKRDHAVTDIGRWTATYARPDLADLLLRLAQVAGIERVRLSSIEPTQVTDRLLDAFAHEPKLCRHLHIPLQSGDTGVLQAMNRPYDQDFYLERCRAAHARIPDLAITSDIMVGFPGEDRAAFENTLHVVANGRAMPARTCSATRRAPTRPPPTLQNQVPEEEKEARSKELAAACRETQQQFIQRYLGRELEVLVEGKEGPRQGDGETESEASGNEGCTKRIAAGNVAACLGSLLERLHQQLHSGAVHGRLASDRGTSVRVRLLEPTSDGAIGEVGGAHFGPQEAPPDADFFRSPPSPPRFKRPTAAAKKERLTMRKIRETGKASLGGSRKPQSGAGIFYHLTQEEYDEMHEDPACDVEVFEADAVEILEKKRIEPQLAYKVREDTIRQAGLGHWIDM